MPPQWQTFPAWVRLPSFLSLGQFGDLSLEKPDRFTEVFHFRFVVTFLAGAIDVLDGSPPWEREVPNHIDQIDALGVVRVMGRMVDRITHHWRLW